MNPSVGYVLIDSGLLALPLDLSSDSLEGGLNLELTQDPTNKTHTRFYATSLASTLRTLSLLISSREGIFMGMAMQIDAIATARTNLTFILRR